MVLKGGGNEEGNETKLINIHSEANFLYVYANPDGYAAFDGGNKGGYLIQSIKKIFNKKEIYDKYMSEIIIQIAKKVKQLVGSNSIQHIQSVSNIHYKIQFAKKKVYDVLPMINES